MALEAVADSLPGCRFVGGEANERFLAAQSYSKKIRQQAGERDCPLAVNPGLAVQIGVVKMSGTGGDGGVVGAYMLTRSPPSRRWLFSYHFIIEYKKTRACRDTARARDASKTKASVEQTENR